MFGIVARALARKVPDFQRVFQEMEILVAKTLVKLPSHVEEPPRKLPRLSGVGVYSTQETHYDSDIMQLDTPCAAAPTNPDQTPQPAL
eukprot:2095047-Amphidinium_carterae.1